MSTAVLGERPVDELAYIQLSPPTGGRQRPSLADDWVREDPVDELTAELRRLGQVAIAQVVDAMRHRHGLDDDEVAMRSLVSARWAEDWDCPEDAVYDSY